VANRMHYEQIDRTLPRYNRTVQKRWMTSIDDRTCPMPRPPRLDNRARRRLRYRGQLLH
jgi:hypothetical protein